MSAAVPAYKATHFAVVVGIDSYSLLRPLQHARGDAEEFKNWLEDTEGGNLDPANVELVTHSVPAGADPQPLRLDVKRAILKMMARADAIYRAKPGGTERWRETRLYFYVAGHGVAGGLSDTALLMADAGNDFWSERVSCWDVLEHLVKDRHSFAELVVFADCCRQEGVGTTPPLFDPVRVQRVNQIPWALFHATQFGTVALEPTDECDLLRGYFTQALLDGLNGAAAPVGTPITSENLRSYVLTRVPELTHPVAGGPQVPSCQYEPQPQPIVFVSNSPGPGVRTVRLRFLACNAPVRLIGGDNRPIRPPFPATPGAEWRLRLRPGLYRILGVDGTVPAGLTASGFFQYSGERNHVHEI